MQRFPATAAQRAPSFDHAVLDSLQCAEPRPAQQEQPAANFAPHIRAMIAASANGRELPAPGSASLPPGRVQPGFAALPKSSSSLKRPLNEAAGADNGEAQQQRKKKMRPTKLARVIRHKSEHGLNEFLESPFQVPLMNLEFVSGHWSRSRSADLFAAVAFCTQVLHHIVGVWNVPKRSQFSRLGHVFIYIPIEETPANIL